MSSEGRMLPTSLMGIGQLRDSHGGHLANNPKSLSTWTLSAKSKQNLGQNLYIKKGRLMEKSLQILSKKVSLKGMESVIWRTEESRIMIVSSILNTKISKAIILIHCTNRTNMRCLCRNFKKELTRIFYKWNI